MKKKVLAVLLVVVVALVGFLYFPRGTVAEAVNNAVLAVLDADIAGSRAGGGFQPALDGEVFATGDVLRADRTGRAVLTFFEGSTLSVDPGSTVKVVSLAKTSSGGIQLEIEQDAGRTWASVSKLVSPDSKFEIRTPSMTAIVRGTAFETIVEKGPDGKIVTTIKTSEGDVLVQAASGGEVHVTAGTQASVEQGQPAPPAPQPQPPTPKLRFAGPAGVGFVVIDPRGLRCGSTGKAAERQIPLCLVEGGGGESVVIADVVPGTYSVVMTAAQAVPDATLAADGLGIHGTDFTVRMTKGLAIGDLVRTSLPVAVGPGGKLSSPGFAPPELVTSACGGEATGRVFASGQVNERADLFVAYARSAKDQPASIVYTDGDLTQAAVSGVRDAQKSLPVTVSDVHVRISGAGVRMTARIDAGPLVVPATAEIIAGVEGGKLVLRTRRLEAGPVPPAVTDALRGAIDRGLDQYVSVMPLVAQRVTFQSGCLALIGRTSP